MKDLQQNFTDAGGGGTVTPRYVVGIEFDPDRVENLEVNKLTYSEQIDNTLGWARTGTPVFIPNTIAEPIGATVTADSIEDNDAANWEFISQTAGGTFDATRGHCFSMYLYKDAVARTTRFPTFRLRFEGSTTEISRLHVDTSDGEFAWSTDSADFLCGVDDVNSNWWRVWIKARSNDPLNTSVAVDIFPAGGADANFATSPTITGSVVLWGAMLSETLELLDYVQTVASIASADVSNPEYLWLTSHADAKLPYGVSTAEVVTGSIIKISGQTQKINPDRAQHTIGNINITTLDINSEITAAIKAKLDNAVGLRKKKIKLWKGYEELLYWDDYNLEFTYLIDKTTYKDGSYKFTCSDIQRTTKQDIFDPHVGVLTSDITASSTTIPITIAAASSKFPLLEHDSIYGSNPSTTIGYIQIEKEIIAHSGWNGSFTALNVVERGALGTRAVAHTNTSTEADKKKKVEEYIYLEMAAPRLIYAILTGVIDGQTGNMPDHWNLGISEELVRLENFQDIGEDLWDTTTNNGRICRFMGLEKEEGKKFIEEEILLWLGAFMPVYSDGAYGLKVMQSVLAYSAYNDYINESSVLKYSDLVYDQTSVINNIAIKWNWIKSLDRFTKTTQLIDSKSIDKFGSASQKNYEFKGVFTGVHTDTDIAQYFNQIRDRYGAPPLRLSITVVGKHGNLEVGDTIRLRNKNIVDARLNDSVDRTFEIQQVRTNWIDGTVTLELFGGTEPAGQDVISSSFVMQDAYYNTQAALDGGTELSTVLTIVGGAVTTNGTITGTNSRKIYYYDGDLTINAGVTVTITKSVELRIRGTLLINGAINGVGQGLAGGAGGTGRRAPGFYGGLGQRGVLGFQGVSPIVYAYSSGTRRGNVGAPFPYPEEYPQRPPNSWNIRNPDGLTIQGLVSNIQGTSGHGGAAVMSPNPPVPPNLHFYRAAGGAGGNSGAGLVAVARGFAFGPSGEIDVSGGDSGLGATVSIQGATFRGGSGVGGAAGACLLLIDGNASTPDITKIKARTGAITRPGGYTYIDENFPTAFTAFSYSSGRSYVGIPWYNNALTSQATHRAIRYIPEAITPFDNLPQEEEQAVIGYGNKPPEWEEIVDSAGTIPEDNATVGAQAGVNLQNSSAQVIGDSEVLNSQQTPEDVQPGTMTGVEFLTSAAGQRIRLSTAGDELEFYGDRGDTTVTQVATIGIQIVGPDTVIGLFGDVAVGNSNVGVYGATYNGTAGVYGASGVRNGVYGVSQSVGNTYAGVYGTGANSAGVRGVSTNRLGVWGSTSALTDVLERVAGVYGSVGSGGANADSYGGWFEHNDAGGVPLLIELDSGNTPSATPTAGGFWISNNEEDFLISRRSGNVVWRKIGSMNAAGKMDIESGFQAVQYTNGYGGTATIAFDTDLYNHFVITSFAGTDTINITNRTSIKTEWGTFVLKNPNNATAIIWQADGGTGTITWITPEPIWTAGEWVVYWLNDGYTGDIKLWAVQAPTGLPSNNVTYTGTPVGNGVAIWDSAGVIEYDAALRFNPSFDALTVGDAFLTQPTVEVSAPAAGGIGRFAFRSGGIVVGDIRWVSNNADMEIRIGSNPVITIDATSITAAQKIITVASAAGGAGLNITPGVAPTTPVDGDIWVTTGAGASVFARANGVTIDLGGAGGGTPTEGTSPFGIIGSGTGSANISIIEFKQSGGTVDARIGYTVNGNNLLDFTADPINAQIRIGTTNPSNSTGVTILAGNVTTANFLNDQLLLRSEIDLAFEEKAAGTISPAIAGRGYVWLRNDRTLVFTDDTDVDYAFAGLNAAGGGTPGGSSGQVQFNDGGAFGGTDTMTWSQAADTLTITSNVTGAGFVHSSTAGVTTFSTASIDQVGVGSTFAIKFDGTDALNIGETDTTLTLGAGGDFIITGPTNVNTRIGPTNVSASNANLALDAGSVGDSYLTFEQNNAPRATITRSNGGYLRVSDDARMQLFVNSSNYLDIVDASSTFGNKVITLASAVGGAGFNLPHGAAPTVPTNGDVWTTTAGVFARVNGVTVDLTETGSGTPGGVSTNVQYNNGGVFDGESNFVYVEGATTGIQLGLTAQTTLTSGSMLSMTDSVGGHTGAMLTLTRSGSSNGRGIDINHTSSGDAAYVDKGSASSGRAIYGRVGGFNVSSAIVGEHNGSGFGVGVQGLASGSGGGYAGYFSRDVSNATTYAVVGIVQDNATNGGVALQIRNDTTGGSHIQLVGNGRGIEMQAGGIQLTARSDHAFTPTTSKGEIWMRSSDDALIYTTPAGVDVDLTAGGGGGGLTLGTAQSPTTGTEVDFTGIPAGVNQVIVTFDQLSHSDASTRTFGVQIGDSGGIESSGYDTVLRDHPENVTSIQTIQWAIAQLAAADTVTGQLILTRVTGNTWIATGLFLERTGNQHWTTAGRKVLSGTLDRVRIRSGGGTGFDSGTINIAYQ